MSRFWLTAALAVTGVLGLSPAVAGPIFYKGRVAGGALKIADGGTLPFAVTYSAATARLAGGTATTSVEETIDGPDKKTQAIMVLPLPADTQADSVTVRIDGKAVEGKFLSPKAANTAIEQISRGTKSSKALSLTGQALFVANYTLGPHAEVAFELRHGITQRDGFHIFSGPMPRADFANAPLVRAKYKIEVEGQKPLRAVFSPTHEVKFTRPDLKQAIVRLTAEGLKGGDNLKLMFVEDADDLGLRVLTHRIEGEDEGYFVAVGNPTGTLEPVDPLPKDIVLVVDTSGSMRGEKMEQAREAVTYCVDHLNPGDRFNIVTFGSTVSRFSEQLVLNSAQSREAAKSFIEDTVSLGRTHISGALKAGLEGKPDATRPRMMIFLTDGTPTAGEMNPETILKSLPRLNTSKTRIYVMGVGKDVNTHLLDRLALQTEGRSVYVPGTDAIDERVASLYDSLSSPLLDGVELSFGGLKVDGVYPKRIPSLFKGGEVMVYGRYSGGGKHTVSLSGTFRGAKKSYKTEVSFPKKAAPEDDFVAALWAARRVGDLLGKVRLEGQKAEWIAEIVRLSQTFGILTEYTRFMADSGEVLSPEAALQKAQALMSTANGYSSGGWAVSQSFNESGLRNKRVQSVDNNFYRDRRGKSRASQKVKQLGRRAFYKKDGRWVQADDGRKRKKRRVKRFSPEYMKLAREQKDFAEAAALDDDVTVNVGSESVEVY